MSEHARARFAAAADPLQPFVPRIAVDWLRETPSERTRSFEGTLVFADVSGFTDLTEALAKRGREGAEEIASVLDATLGELIGAAYAHQADLLKFGGDAVLLLFRGESHRERAVTAATEMRAVLSQMRRLATSAGPVRLKVSIGAHSGTFHLFLVGGIHRELIIAGADATACVQAEAAANAGEIALSATTARQFDLRVLGERRDGVVLLRESPGAPDTVAPFFDPSGVDLSVLLPPAYTRELRGVPADPEHRHVAVAFVEIGGTDELLEREGPDALAVALDERIATIQELCHGLEVTFAQTDISNGAVKVILLAGAPRSAGGEEEELMLRATRAIADRPGSLPLRIGVNAGRVFAGIVGTPTRRTYTYYGDVVNTAARIMARAGDGQLLTHETVLERARTTYAVVPIDPFAAKGKAGLVRAVDVGAPVGERELDAVGPFVGREPELETMLAALERAREGHGGLVIVAGDPGLGKTRLVSELTGHAADAQVLRAQCAQSGASHPYSTIGMIVRRALRLGIHASTAEIEERLREVVNEIGEELEPWLPLLGVVVGLDLPPTPESAALDERFASERIATSVETLLEEVVPDTAVFVVDDAHLMDEVSGELIGRIAQGIGTRRWLLVVVDAYGERFVAPDNASPIEVSLAPLKLPAALFLTQQLTADAPLPAHVAEAIAARSTGSPLFVQEMVAAVRAGADPEELPGSVEALMAVEIDELASADRGVLRQASVLGARFTRDGLMVAVGLDEADAKAVLGRLERFLVADGDDGFRFRHGLLRDAAYHGLSFRRRRRLHRAVGEALERSVGDELAAVADELTHHFYEAGMWGKALQYGVLAGSSARAVFANVDAAPLFERAVAAGAQWRSARPEAIIRAAEALGDVRLSLGELEKARAAFALARRRLRGDAVERARLLRKEANVAYRLGAYPKAQRILSGALELLADIRSAPAAAQRARIEALLGIITLWRGRPREAVEWFERAIADGEPVEAKKALAHALAGLDLAHNALGDSKRAVYSARALRIYDELGDLVSKGGVLNNLGTIAYYAGRWNEALDLYREARAEWDRAGDTRSVSMAAFNIGEILSGQGKLDEAEPLLREAERSSRAAGGATDIAESLMETALLDARRGNLERALAQLGEVRALLAGGDGGSAALLLEARTAEALELGGEYHEAIVAVERALERTAGDESGALVLPVLHRVLGQAQLLAGRPEAARVALAAAIVEADRVQHRYEEAHALDALARIGAPDDVVEYVSRRDELVGQLGIVVLPTRWALLAES